MRQQVADSKYGYQMPVDYFVSCASSYAWPYTTLRHIEFLAHLTINLVGVCCVSGGWVSASVFTLLPYA
jgi:hypothetical protein